MAVRRWRAFPDQVMQTPDGEVGVCSREAQLEAILDGVAMCDRSGGGFTVTYGRHPTDMPGESVTTGVVVEWRSRTDAKAQPEPQVDVLPQQAEMDDLREQRRDAALTALREGEKLDEQLVEEIRQEAYSDEPDGFDTSKLEEEDLSAMPEGMR